MNTNVVTCKKVTLDTEIDAIVEKIKRRRRREGKAILETGRRLIEMAERLEDGPCKYGTGHDVLQHKLGLTVQTAHRYMRYALAADKAEQWGQLNNFLKLRPSVVDKAFAPSVPEEASYDILISAFGRQEVTVEWAEYVIESHTSRLRAEQDAFEDICWHYDCLLEAHLKANKATREMAIDRINQHNDELQLVWPQAKCVTAA